MASQELEMAGLGSQLSVEQRQRPQASRETPIDNVKTSKQACCRLCAVYVIVIVIVVTFAARRRVLSLEQRQPLVMSVVQNASYCQDVVGNSSMLVCVLDATPEQEEALHLDENGKALLGFLYKQLAQEHKEDMLQLLAGAHATVTDPDQQLERFLLGLDGAYDRISSHKSDITQHGVDLGDTLVTILVGKSKQKMWLQFEAGLFNLKSWEKICASLPHVLDSVPSPLAGFVANVSSLQTFLAYRATGKNVGPLGLSDHHDANPLHFETWRDVQQACPKRCNNSARR